MGCINPDVLGCPYRKPYGAGEFRALTPEELARAHCYLGHRECREEQEEVATALEMVLAAWEKGRDRGENRNDP
ncbi:hypothetical protein V3F56_09020 [Moorellaceae bacterium AZ2]